MEDLDPAYVDPAAVFDRRWGAACELPRDLVTPRRVDPQGRAGPTRGQAAGRRFRQTSAGRYVPSAVDGTRVEQRILEQGTRLGAYGAVTGWAALRWRGAAYFNGIAPGGEERPVPLVVGRSRLMADPRVMISEAQLAPSERTWVRGLWVATTQRALFDEMRWATGIRAAVVAMDMAAAAQLISVALMSEYVGRRQAWTGVPDVRRALVLSSDESRSPQETLLRLFWTHEAGFAPPLCNRPVFSREGRLLGTPDLLDVEAGVVGEYDGKHHRSAEQHRIDVEREARFREHGLEYFTVVEGEMSRRTTIVNRRHATRSRARFEHPAQRRWTLEHPSWWQPADDLDTHLLRTGQAPWLGCT